MGQDLQSTRALTSTIDWCQKFHEFLGWNILLTTSTCPISYIFLRCTKSGETSWKTGHLCWGWIFHGKLGLELAQEWGWNHKIVRVFFLHNHPMFGGYISLSHISKPQRKNDHGPSTLPGSVMALPAAPFLIGCHTQSLWAPVRS